MPQYSFELDTLQDWYNTDHSFLTEAITSMREQSQQSCDIVIERRYSNTDPEVLFRLRTNNELDAWILRTFPKRIYYYFSKVRRNTLDFVLVKSTQPMDAYSIKLKITHPQARIIVMSQGPSGLPVLTGTEHDINCFSVQENFDDFEWTLTYLIDPNKPYA